MGKNRFRAYSAGRTRTGEINPFAISLLDSLGYPTSGLRSKSWEEFSGSDAADIDFVFTVCDSAAKEICPIWPGHPMAVHWGLPDPAAAKGTKRDKSRAFEQIYKTLSFRIEQFLKLALDTQDKISLRRLLTEIGKLPPPST